jgi:hypothetical protein
LRYHNKEHIRLPSVKAEAILVQAPLQVVATQASQTLRRLRSLLFMVVVVRQTATQVELLELVALAEHPMATTAFLLLILGLVLVSKQTLRTKQQT